MSPNRRNRSPSAWSRCAARPTPTTTSAAPATASARPRGRAQGRLPARAVPHPVLLPDRGPADVRPRRADPRPDDRGARRRRAGDADGRRRLALRAPGGRASTTTRRSSSTPTARSRGIYRKMHIPDDPLYYEKFYFTPGDLGFQAFDTRSPASARWSAGTSGIPRPPA